MPAERPKRPRRQRAWILRGALAATAMVAAFFSVREAIGFASLADDAARAHAISPEDGRIAAVLALQLSTTGDPANLARVKALAEEALRQEPLAPSAIAALAVGAQSRGDTMLAGRLLSHSDALSRRDLGTRLLLIEEAVAKQDVPGALRHYDIALRTSRNAGDLLFPILTSALTDRAIGGPLADLLAANPPWGVPFIRYVVTGQPDVDVMTGLMRLLDKRRAAVPDDLRAALINTLATRGRVTEAWTLYRGVRRAADAQRSRDPSFSTIVEAPTLFDWMPVQNDAGISGSIQKTSEGGVFDFAAPVTVGGIALQQLQLLPPGRYHIEGRVSGLEQAAAELPYWTLVCTDARELGRVELSAPAGGVSRFGGIVTVDSRCPAQLLRFVIRPASNIGGVAGQIERALLQPYQGAN